MAVSDRSLRDYSPRSLGRIISLRCSNLHYVSCLKGLLPRSVRKTLHNCIYHFKGISGVYIAVAVLGIWDHKNIGSNAGPHNSLLICNHPATEPAVTPKDWLAYLLHSCSQAHGWKNSTTVPARQPTPEP